MRLTMKTITAMIAFCAFLATTCDFNPWDHPGYEPHPQTLIDSVTVMPATMRLGVDTCRVTVYARTFVKGETSKLHYTWIVQGLISDTAFGLANTVQIYLPNDTSETFPANNLQPLGVYVAVKNQFADQSRPYAFELISIPLYR